METVIRVAVIYLFLVMALRVVGKRELGELSAYELLMIMLIPDIVSQGLVRNDYSITNSLIGVSTLLCLVLLNSILSYRFDIFRNVMEGKPIVLFYQGQFVEKTLNRERLGPDEILAEIRAKGYERFDQMKWIILEPDGQISCIPHERAHKREVL